MTRTSRLRRLVCSGLALALGAGLALPARAAEVKLIGITVGSLGNPYYAVTDRGIEETAKQLTPGAKITAVSADYDLSKQFTQIQNFMAAGAQIVMLNAVDPVAIAPAVKQAQAAGMVIAAFDVAAQGADITVMTDNVKAGWEACDDIVKHLPATGGNVVIVNGPQISAIVDRVAGCKKALATNPNVHILSSNQNGQASRDGGFAVGQGILTQFPKIDAIFAINDPTAIGVDLAAKQMGRHEFFITSVDGSPDVVAALKDPHSLIRSSAAQAPYKMAAESYRIGVGILNGTKPASKIVLLAPTLVTRENVQSFGGWSSQN